MPRKKKKSIMDELFGESLFDESEDLFEKFGDSEGGGYSISVTRTPEGTKVHAKVGKDTDVNELKRKLQGQYPNAQIEIEGGKPLIREISTKTIDEDRKKDLERIVCSHSLS